MKQFLHLLKFDFMLLYRHKIMAVSAIVTSIYVGIFYALGHLEQIEKMLVLVIFNDPALLGFLFVGVMVLFEKDENTLEALAVTPINMSNYILSKALALTSISLLCCYAMAIAGHGFQTNFVHFSVGTVLTTFIFAMFGFITVAGQASFNKFILRMLGVILFLALPFLGYFELLPSMFFVLFPTQPAISLYHLSFAKSASVPEILYAYSCSLLWAGITYKWALHTITKNVIR